MTKSGDFDNWRTTISKVETNFKIRNSAYVYRFTSLTLAL